MLVGRGKELQAMLSTVPRQSTVVIVEGQTGTGVTSTHSYPNAQRTYTAQLKVTDRAGNSHTASQQIQRWSFGSQAFCFGQ